MKLKIIYSTNSEPVEGATVHAEFWTGETWDMVTSISDGDGIATLTHTVLTCPSRGDNGYGARILDITGDGIFFDYFNLNFFEWGYGGPNCPVAE